MQKSGTKMGNYRGLEWFEIRESPASLKLPLHWQVPKTNGLTKKRTYCSKFLERSNALNLSWSISF